MKKALVVLLALGCLGAAAFADAPVATWGVTGLYGFGVYSPSAGNSIVAYDYSMVGTNRTRLDFKLTSADGNAGFNTEAQYVGLAASAAGNGIIMNWTAWQVWGKLFDGMLTVKGGQLDDYGPGTKDWFNWGTLSGEDAYVGPGIAFELAPTAGLKILFFQQIPVLGIPTPANLNGDQVGLTYDAANIGGVQVGSILNNTYGTLLTQGTQVYFGFNVTAVPNLTLIEETNVWLLNGNTPIAGEAYVSYVMGMLTIGSRFAIWTDTKGTDWGIEPLITYKVDSNWAVNGIVGIYNYGNGTFNKIGYITFYNPVDAGTIGLGDAKTTNIGLGASVTYTLSGFTLSVGDYYAAGTNQGNLIYVNSDVTL